MINHKDRYIFIHIPRTGGTSIEYVLNNNKSIPIPTSELHWKYIDYINNFNNIEKYYIFSVIRNPWDRLLSIYNEPNNPFKIEDKTFNDWISNFLDIGPRNILVNQYEYLIYMENSYINYICKFEKLEEDFNKVCDILKIKNKKLPHINKTNHIHYTDAYTDKTINIVKNLYFKDIEYFEYKFGD